MVSDRLSRTEISSAADMRRMLVVDRPSAGIFECFARVIARAFGASNAVVAFGDPTGPWLEFRCDLDVAGETVIATAPLRTSTGGRLGELRVLDRGSRYVSPEQARLLEELAVLVAANYEARIDVLRLAAANDALAAAILLRRNNRAVRNE